MPDRAAVADAIPAGGKSGRTHRPAQLGELMDECDHTRAEASYPALFHAAAEATSPEDTPYNRSIKLVRQSLMHGALRGTLARDVPGAVAECGCFRGQAAWMMATMLRDEARERHRDARALHLFDSFEGLSAFGEHDREGLDLDEGTIARRRANFAFPEARLRENLAGFDGVRVHAGWIPDRFDEVADERFAFVHVDVDLHDPTRDSLAFFWPRLSPGGAIVVDDYNSVRFPGCTRAVDAFAARERPAALVAGQAGACVIVKASAA